MINIEWDKWRELGEGGMGRMGGLGGLGGLGRMGEWEDWGDWGEWVNGRIGKKLVIFLLLNSYFLAETSPRDFVNAIGGISTIAFAPTVPSNLEGMTFTSVENSVLIKGIFEINPKSTESINRSIVILEHDRPSHSSTQSHSSQIASLHNRIIPTNSNNVTVTDIAVNKPPMKIAPFYDRILQITSSEVGHYTKPPFDTRKITVDKFSTIFLEVNAIENSSSEIDSNELNLPQSSVLENNIAEISFPSRIPFQQFSFSNFSHNSIPQLDIQVLQAIQ